MVVDMESILMVIVLTMHLIYATRYISSGLVRSYPLRILKMGFVLFLSIRSFYLYLFFSFRSSTGSTDQPLSSRCYTG